MALHAPFADTICSERLQRWFTVRTVSQIRWVCLSMILFFAAGCEFSPAPSPTAAPPPTIPPTFAPTPSSTPAPTAAPTALAAWSINAQPLDTVIRLSWSPVAGARSYNIYRDGGATPVNTAPVAEATYEDIGLSNGHSYRYGVAALDSNGKVLTRSAELTVAPKAP
jgi:hypothetical protein